MATKKFDLAIKTGEYETQGGTKGRYQNIGVIMEGEKGPYMLVNPLFLSSQLGAVANKDGRESLIVSMFEPREAGDKPAASKPGSRSSGGATDDLDGDIPFARHGTRRTWGL